MGKQAIQAKPEPQGINKPYNKVTTNYCRNITENFLGYLVGKDITYNSDEDIEEIQNVLNYNDVASEDSMLLKQALIYGVAYEVCYVDEEGQQRFAIMDSRDTFPVYYNTLNRDLAAVIRYYLVDSTDQSKGYYVEVYGEEGKMIFKANSVLSTLVDGDLEPNYYDQIPVTVFELNEEQVSIFDCIMELQDAYNTLLSAEIDDFQSFCDAYLVLKGMMIDEDEAAKIRDHRLIDLGDTPDANAFYLTKNINDTQIQNLLDGITKNIHKISCSPDFTQEEFGTSSGIALKYRLLAFENRSGAIEKAMTKALQKRIELICAILSKVNGIDAWRDIQITFTRNLPIDMADIITTVNGLRGLVSDRTLLAQIPFVQDIDAELDLIAEQNEKNMELYGFGNEGDEDEVLDRENRQSK